MTDYAYHISATPPRTVLVHKSYVNGLMEDKQN